MTKTKLSHHVTNLIRRRTGQPPGTATGELTTPGVRVSVDELLRLRLQVRGFVLASRRDTATASAGIRQSRFRGRGVDFQESRAYQPGDDIRNMDWRVTARSGRPHTKLYREERERPVIIMLDLGASMFFGTRVAFKSVTAAKVAALIGWAAVQNGDRVGAVTFGQRGHHEIPPTGGRRGVLGLIRELVAWTTPENDTGGGADSGLGMALQRLRRVARPGSLVCILSDFYSFDGDLDHHLARLRQHNDVVACQIKDALEQTSPPPGRYGITDGQRVSVLDTDSVARRRAYEAVFARHDYALRELLRKRAVPHIPLVSDEDLVAGLRRGLANAMIGSGAPGVG